MSRTCKQCGSAVQTMEWASGLACGFCSYECVKAYIDRREPVSEMKEMPWGGTGRWSEHDEG